MNLGRETYLDRSNVTIVSPNASRTLKRYYSKSKCTSDAQTLLWYCQALLGPSNVTIVMPNAPRTLKRYYSKSSHVSCPRIIFWFESEANRDPVFRDHRMVAEVRNRSLFQLVSLTIRMCWNSLLKLELWSHRSAFGSIAWCLLSQCIFHLIATKVSVAITLSVMYPYGSTTKGKENKDTMAARSNHVVSSVPLWVDHKM